MRPRVFPAEDGELGRGDGVRLDASMRPRVFPAEDPIRHVWIDEAHVASMRPRVFPAEDVSQLYGVRIVNLLQ